MGFASAYTNSWAWLDTLADCCGTLKELTRPQLCMPAFTFALRSGFPSLVRRGKSGMYKQFLFANKALVSRYMHASHTAQARCYVLHDFELLTKHNTVNSPSAAPWADCVWGSSVWQCSAQFLLSHAQKAHTGQSLRRPHALHPACHAQKCASTGLAWGVGLPCCPVGHHDHCHCD